MRDASVTAQGGGVVDLGGAVAGELTADPATLAFGRAQGDGWHVTQELTVRNVSTRRLSVRPRNTGSGGLLITSKPRRLRLKPGGHATLILQARLEGTPSSEGSAEGSLLLTSAGTEPLKVPWAITFGPPPGSLISAVALSQAAFRPSDTTPAVLSLRAGLVTSAPAGAQVQPVSRLDVELWHAGHRLGLLARLRDLLPGRVAIGLTGRGPGGTQLLPGRYQVRLLAYPTSDGPATRRTIAFRIK
jgi:hypothetical protein